MQLRVRVATRLRIIREKQLEAYRVSETAVEMTSGAPRASPHAVVESRDPVSGEVWRRHETMDVASVRDRVARARAAQPEWGQRAIRDRARIIDRFRALLVQRRGDVADTIRREMGKPVVEAMSADVAPVLDHAAFLVSSARRALATRRHQARGIAHLRKQLVVTHDPYGVVGVIAPWNYPMLLSSAHVLPALLAGNAVLLKPSELTTETGLMLGRLLHEAGVPQDVMHVLPGAGATGAALITEGCDKIFFTGSERTGRLIAHACAERLIPCVLELGGSDPAIVLEDAVIDVAAAGIVWGRFSNCGQSCIAPKRVYVVDVVYDRVVEAIGERVRALTAGDTGSGADVGPPAHPRQYATILSQLEDALERGARVEAQGPVSDATRFVPPTVLTRVPPNSRVLAEETFGPLLPIVRVKDEDEAVRLANDTPFGLSATVWSRDLRRAEALARRLDAGTIMVNDVLASAGMADVAHGGVKASGFGRSHGLVGFEECTRTRTIVVDRMPSLMQPWWFGYSPGFASALDGFVRAVHGRGLRQRLRGFLDARPLLRRLRLRPPDTRSPL
jgi:acyl-CoA reductase-like NAD-dependent aldehyde dehydrogenase